MRAVLVVAFVALLAMPSRAMPQTASPAAQAPAVLQTVVIDPRRPGPPMWKVRKGDHVLWILGTEPTLRTGLIWDTRAAEAVLLRTEEVLFPPNIAMGLHVGFFGKLALLPALVGARDQPGGRSLQDSVPADAYARWSALRLQYMRDRRNAEHWRPVFAALELHANATAQADLSRGDFVGRQLERLHKAHPERHPLLVKALVEAPLDDPRAKLVAFKRDNAIDASCFIATVAHLGGDLATLESRADAWAEGDIGTLRALPDDTQYDACNRVLTAELFGSAAQRDALQAQSRAKWMANARTALGRSTVSFATLPFRELIARDGLVASLAAEGYVVEAPSPDRGNAAH